MVTTFKFAAVDAVPVMVPLNDPSKLATMVPTAPLYTFAESIVALGMKVNLPTLSSKPKNPVVAVPELDHLNSIPLSILLSRVECVPPAPDPTTITGSTIVDTVESTVIVLP